MRNIRKIFLAKYFDIRERHDGFSPNFFYIGLKRLICTSALHIMKIEPSGAVSLAPSQTSGRINPKLFPAG